jgi:hypothetical protein
MFLEFMYSQTCIKRSALGQSKSGLIRQVTSQKRFNSYELFYEVMWWAGLTVFAFEDLNFYVN